MQINFVRNLRTRITLIAWTIVLLSISTFGLSRPLPSTAAPSDPSLTLVGSIGGAVYSVAASESLIYVGEGRGALAILRNESSAAVHVVSRLILPNVVHDIKVAEGIAYLSLGTAGLYIVDVHIPEAPVENWAFARRGAFYKPIKQPVNIRIDADVLDWFKRHAEGRGYQTEINRVLRRHVIAKEKQR